jgi:response regulator RpfG family c-di-GMP phosphodiesterase
MQKLNPYRVKLDEKIKVIKVLLVEDKLNQLLMKIILEDFNFEISIADNGKLRNYKQNLTILF